MRFRRGRTYRREPRRLRWIEGIAQTVSSSGNYSVLPLLNQAGTAASPIVTIIDPKEVQEQLDGNGTIIRVVGDYSLNWPLDIVNSCAQGTGTYGHLASNLIWIGIRAMVIPPAGTIAAFDVSDAAIQDASWMYLKMHYMQMPAFRQSEHVYDFAQPARSFHVDIRARRKLRQDEGLVMYACGASASDDGVNACPAYGSSVTGGVNRLFMCATLRVLCKLG